ncbi:CELP0027 Effector like protein [Blumeria hordei DH14]|uniref:AA9 family lytic polysaccharide monooxygenase n=1 Tax=Blumeria graminis f. sp. hordei (strain DH14) TaxID=546991 RepID=N1JA82_BLUG1|nr:CELP0027 Effector like protein [Blumeria hordei DH14]
MTLFLRLSLLLAATASAVDAHSLFTTLHINDQDQGDGTCIRMPKEPSTATNPVEDLQDPAMVCGFDGTNGVQRVCKTPQGSTLGFEYHTYPDRSQEGSIEPSHKGPCAVYMKAVPSASEASGEGEGWFKVWEQGYDSSSKKWCSDNIIDNNGIMNVQLPSDLAGGEYLVRSELLALHEADKSPPNPQFYVGCAQIYLDSQANAAPPPDTTVSIPGHVKISDPSVLFNIYTPSWPYTMPGPRVYSNGIPSENRQTSRSENRDLPPRTIAVNANWYGTEQEPYNTESGCWTATTNCFQQAHSCYSTSPPTGSKGCRVYEKKCTKMQQACGSGNFNGPPDQGQVLTPGIKDFHGSQSTAAYSDFGAQSRAQSNTRIQRTRRRTPTYSRMLW